jgi:hypothetical protein
MALQTVMHVIRQIAEVTLTYRNPGIRVPGYPGSYPAGTRVVKIPGFESTSAGFARGNGSMPVFSTKHWANNIIEASVQLMS